MDKEEFYQQMLVLAAQEVNSKSVRRELACFWFPKTPSDAQNRSSGGLVDGDGEIVAIGSCGRRYEAATL